MDKDIKKIYKPFENFLIRTPLLPMRMVSIVNDNNLKEIMNNPIIEEALFLASPILFNEYKKWLDNKIIDIREEKRIVNSLMKYLLRMSSRCTPFGLFAGCTICSWEFKEKMDINNSNSINISPTSLYKSFTRLDMHFLCAVNHDIANNPLIKQKLKYFPNHSIYKHVNKYRYIEFRYVNNRRVHHLVAVDSSEILDKILEISQNGIDINSLTNDIISEEINYEEAFNFICQLVDIQFLINELDPKITGKDILNQSIQILNQFEEIKDVNKILQEIKDELQLIDSKAIGRNISMYYNITKKIEKLGAPYDIHLLFQTDLIKPPISNILSNSYIDTILTGVSVLRRFSRSNNRKLTDFRAAYIKRYEYKEMPLLEVLDPETGIGYLQYERGEISPLIDNIMLGLDFVKNKISNEFDKLQSFLFNKYFESLQINAYELKINAEDIASLNWTNDDLPDTFSVMAQFYKDKIHIISAGGSSAANLLGRFCHTDEKIYELVKHIAEKEKSLNPSAIIAEIVHLPESRVGNILLRPKIYDYEIPILARSSVDQNAQIQLKDLMISLNSDRIIIKSKKLNKEIIPRLTTAHNYTINSLPVYHFLCDLQKQNLTSNIYFDWGILNFEAKFLPRVSYDNIILSLAQWNLQKSDYKGLVDVNDDELLEQIHKWRQANKMPRYIAISDSDNELLIDLENSLCVKTFISIIKNRNTIRIVEVIYDIESTIVKSVEGHFMNQVIIPFFKKEKLQNDDIKAKLVKSGENLKTTPFIQRTFILGDEWIFYKFFMGSKTQDFFIVNVIKGLTIDLMTKGLIDKWFFIRYNDPEPHIRVRFHGLKKSFYTKIITQIRNSCKDLIDKNILWKVETGTYVRELERYGNVNIDIVEYLFFLDSKMVLFLIEKIEKDKCEENRWLFCLLAIDSILEDFHYSLLQKKDLMYILSENYNNEFKISKITKTKINQKFRIERELINKILSCTRNIGTERNAFVEVIKEKSNLASPFIKILLDLNAKNILHTTLNDLVVSHIHMLCNRLFRSQQRMHELVLYNFLYKYYSSEISKREFLIKTEEGKTE